EELAYDAKAVRAERRSGFRHLDDRIDEPLGDLRLGGAPRELDVHVDLPFREPAAGGTDEPGRQPAPPGGPPPLAPPLAADDEHPAGGAEARLRVDQLLRHDHVRGSLEHPVAAGDAGIQRAALDVAGHLLRAHEETAEARIVDRREVAARVRRDLPARAAKE